MENDKWYRVDNVAKVFLATLTDRDSRTIRVSVTLLEKIDPELLQKALDKTIENRNTFQVRIRRGIFWHYIEQTDFRPVVAIEGNVCPLLYGKHYKGKLHYQVTYYNNRINFEVFHALTDGTGAIDFTNILVLNYLKLKYGGELSNVFLANAASAGELEQDSFSQNYEKHEKPEKNTTKSYRLRGRRLPYNQLQYIKVSLPAKEILAKAKSGGVSITSYVSACLMLAIYKDMPLAKRKQPVTISIPVNLRNLYESETGRNFFNSISIKRVFEGNEDVYSLAKWFDVQLKNGLSPELVKKQMTNYQELERNPFIRVIPLFLKQPVVKFFARKDAKTISGVISNLGIVKVPEELKKYISDYELFCSHNGLYISLCTYGDKLNLGITNGFRNTGVLRDFIQRLTEGEIKATVYASEVVK